MKNTTKSRTRATGKTSRQVSSKPASRMTGAERMAFITGRIRKGDYTAIAKTTGYHLSHVARVIKGERANPSGEIVKAAYSRVSKRRVTAA